MHGAALALFPLDERAADQGRPGAPLGTGAIALAQNCADPAETDTVWQSAVEAGATALKRPEKVFWGLFRLCRGPRRACPGHRA